MNKLRVGVLMGGKSIEREVSFNSGRTVCDHLDTQRYEIIPIFQKKSGDLFILPWHFLYRGKTNDFEHRLDSEAKKIIWDDLKALVDFMYLAVHGRFAEDGTVQGFLEIATIITDSNLNEIEQGPDLIIHQPQEKLVSMDSWALKTHRSSGLIDAVRNSSVFLKTAEEKTLNFFKKHCDPDTALLAGNSVWQDRNFLKKYMPSLVDFCYYRVLDVTAIRLLSL